MADIAEKPDNPSTGRTPWHNGNRACIRDQIERVVGILEPGDSALFKVNTSGEGPLQFAGHDGDIFVNAKQVTKSEADKLYIIFLNK